MVNAFVNVSPNNGDMDAPPGIRWVKGSDVVIGDVIDFGDGFEIVRFDVRHESYVGRRRIAYNRHGEALGIYDEHVQRCIGTRRTA